MNDIGMLVEESLAVDMPERISERQGGALLSPAQYQSFRAAYGIILKHRALLLYEMTGTGKTYVASALAAALQHEKNAGCVIVAPAHLLDNWRVVLSQFNVSARLYSYQAASLGKIPEGDAWNETWIFDEAHYLKNPATKRWQNLMPLSARHRVCLITATPLSLGWRDLHALMMICGFPHDGQMVYPQYVYAFAYALMPISRTEGLRLDISAKLDRRKIMYRMSREHEVSSCIRAIKACAWFTCTADDRIERVPILAEVLLHRLHSHRTACISSLRRLRKYYRACRLTPHRQLLSRKTFVQMIAAEGIQLMLPFEDTPFGAACDADCQQAMSRDWKLLEQAIQDLESSSAARDEKLDAVVSYIQTVPPCEKIVLFTQYRDTALYFERGLRDIAVCALMTSREVRYNGLAISPDVVFAMFDPGCHMPEWWARMHRPDARLLVCTDAFACGQNFQKASWLIHLDLPWNPTVLEQREGRIIRRGQLAECIHVAACYLDTPDPELMCFEQELVRRLNARKHLQATWLADNTNRIQTDELLYVPGDEWPNFWGRFGASWLPVAPASCADLRVQNMTKIKFSSAFDDNLMRYRRRLHDIWNDAKARRDYAAFQNHLSFMRRCACFPQLEWARLREGCTDMAEIPVPDANDSCWRIRVCTEDMPINSQIIHKLSTG
ncbi:MAG: DEAD/DEAH box helicase [Proteobacteria bacterium]|nr:DEAD/DEAH box helicase [Pseudomonadota bacterium]